MLKKLTFFLLLLAFAGAANAQALWSETTESNIPQVGERRIVPQIYRTVRLEKAALQPLLASAPERFTDASAQKNDLPILAIPMPDGKTSRFRLTESPVMAPALQAKFPEIRTYTGRGIDDPTALLKCDFTPQGFHAMIISASHGTVFIDPYSVGDTEHYVVYFKKDYLPKSDDAPFVCETPDENWKELTPGDAAQKAQQGDCQLRRYRLALACTGEYATFHGSTKPLALAAMNTTMNRVNGVYENDLAITMQLIPNNDTLIYLNAATDPYTNNNASAMLTQNQTNITSVIGPTNYDIGHVFGAAGTGGVAGLGVVCNNSNKARGVTGVAAPVGDPFDIDYVAHEMGHQFGGPHSFNGNAGSCNGNGSAANAVEPGSGTTIMAYAGICGAQNIQPNSDDYFHANSIMRMTAFAINGTGNNCPVKIVTGNNNPTASAGSDYTIPKSTPFALTAGGFDMDGDTLTYCWEQMDAALGTPNPPAPTNATGPLFRSFKGTTSPTRWFPRLSDLVSNTNYAWEELPGVARTMNFRVTVRDNNDGAGCTAEDDVLITVAGTAGPFTVTAPNTNELWYVGESKTVTWDVSNTDVAPVACTNVRIRLSTDGGFNYPIVLAANVPNTGSANVLVPNNLSNTCRVKVEALGNIFFDISNQNFRIELPPVPTFSLSPSATLLEACAGDTVSFTTDVISIAGFANPVELEVSGAPAGSDVAISPNPATPGGSALITITNLTPAMAGNYTLTVQGTSGMVVKTADVQLSLLPGAPAATTVLSPADGASGQPLNASLIWNVAAFTENYVVELSPSPSFVPLIFSQTLAGTSVQTTTLQGATVYYWRVKAQNDCGQSDFSPTYAFQTGNLDCNQLFISADVPKTIDVNSVNTVVSNLNVPVGKSIADVDVTLLANHTYVGDLNAKLIAPWGDTALLFDRPGSPASQFGCSGNNLSLIFNDAAALTAADLEAMCNTVNPALLGEFQSITPLATYNGKIAQGDWKIAMTDHFADDGGSLTAWSLTFCFADSISPGVLVENNPLTVPAGGDETVTNGHLALSLSGAPSDGQFILLSLPQHGVLSLAGFPLGVGDVFTQDDIDNNLLIYTHNGDNATTDAFQFDALDQNNFSWVHNAIFSIIILQNDLAATAAPTQGILCNNDATGEITVTATGLDGDYLYSLNGGANQASNVFGGLHAGTYTVVVTGQFGFTATANTITLNNPPVLSATASVADDDITVNATGGTGALEYSLDGTNFQAFNIFENVANGIYTVTVRDANGCTATTEAIVAVNTLLANLTIQNQISCFGGNNGSLSVTVGGGQTPYEYSLNGSAFQSGNSFAGLAAGGYTVVVKDNQGFTTTSNTVTLTNPAELTASAAANFNVVTVTASGGTGVLEYSLDGEIFQTSNVFEGLANGDYTVTVRDANGCTTTAQVTVNVDALAIVSVVVSGELLCYGDQTATVEITVSGGVPPYEYALDGGAYQSSNVFNNVGGGAHVVTVRDAQGVEVQSSQIGIPEPAELLAEVYVDGNDAEFNVAGGAPPYIYSCDCAIPPVDLPNGDYTFLVVDANGCIATDEFTINIPALTATVQVNNSNPCDQSVEIVVTPAGGEPPYQYSLDGGTFQDDSTFTAFAGTHNVRVRDAAGTIFQVPVNVTLPPPLSITADDVDGDIVVMVMANSGTPPYQYSKDGVNFQPSNIFTDVANGFYTITVKDANGCIATTQLTDIVEPNAAWGLNVFPNPSAGLFQLTMSQAPATLRAEVFDATGRSIRTLDFVPNGGEFSASIDLQDVAQGIYLLRLIDGASWGSVRLSVMR